MDWDGNSNFCLPTKYNSCGLLSWPWTGHVHVDQTGRNQTKPCTIDHTSSINGVPHHPNSIRPHKRIFKSRGDFLIWGPLEASDRTQQFIYLAAGLALTYGMLILVVDIFVPLGQILGRLMNINQNPIWAYSVNILGSIFGAWAFVLFSYLYQPPFVWFLIAASLFACFIIWSNRGQENLIRTTWTHHYPFMVCEPGSRRTRSHLVSISKAKRPGKVNPTGLGIFKSM